MAERGMERATGAAAGSGGVPLETLLGDPGTAGALLVLGAAAVPGSWPAAGTVRAADPEPVRGGPFSAALWQAPPGAVSGAALERLRTLLVEEGRLVLTGGPAPAGDGAELRERVRRLSEAGFVVLREVESGGRGELPAIAARRDPFRVRPWQESDRDAVARLFEESFHAERSAAHWRWKYDQNPWGGRRASVAVAPDGSLAAYYTGYPVPLWRDGAERLALQMGDTMTAPRWRRVGRGTSSLLARTVRHFFACHRAGPFDFYFGFNTGGIQRFCRWFIGGSLVEPVAYRARAGAPWAPVSGYRIERITSVDAGFDRLFLRAAPDYGFLVRRDARWIDWRYRRSPDGEPYVVLAARRFGRLVGWSVLRRRGDRVRWGDALFERRHARAAGALLARAAAEPELQGAAAWEAWFPDRPAWWSEELVRLGFARAPEPDGLGFMMLPEGEPPPLDRLYYTMGDGDLF
jgi:hypothetical protein